MKRLLAVAFAAASQAVIVDAIGEVRADGSFALHELASSSDDAAFAEAVRGVVRFWLLRPGYGADCTPHAAAAQVRVWFEHKDGKPVISVSQAAQAPTEGKPIKVTRRRNPEYPSRMAARGMSGTMETLMRISPDGHVEALEMVPGPITQLVPREVSMALRQWRFEPRAQTEGPACGSFVLDFKIGGFPGNPSYQGPRRDGGN